MPNIVIMILFLFISLFILGLQESKNHCSWIVEKTNDTASIKHTKKILKFSN